MINIGVDCVEIEQFETISTTLINKIFTSREISYCNSKAKPSQHFAVRFAGKEAVLKALSCLTIPLNKIEILNDAMGAPSVNILEPRYKQVIKLSLSHSDKTAFATAIAQGV